jgi:UDP:flavonoid glycosyltransferase YjiC (YdhE family)
LKRVLFVAEAVTLAHIARPLVLGGSLDLRRYQVALACDPRCQWLLRDFAGEYSPIRSIEGRAFLDALARGKPVYDVATLEEYVRDDLDLLARVKPDAVVGDFRLSLSVSARLAQVPYVAITNAYWSPFFRPALYPVPSLPLTRALPVSLAGLLFWLARPLAFAYHCRPLNAVRRRHGLPSLGSDLRRVYTDADQTLYADVPEFFPGITLPANHRFIGPIIWAPPVDAPSWWNDLPADRPLIYVTLGSSGQENLLPQVLNALSTLKVTVIAASAGGCLPTFIPANAHVARYLPGDEAARRARLVICNGGSPTSQQALAAGVPVIGITSNLDQLLNMASVVRAGAGQMLRADRFSGHRLKQAVTRLLASDYHRAQGLAIARIFASHSSSQCFSSLMSDLLP